MILGSTTQDSGFMFMHLQLLYVDQTAMLHHQLRARQTLMA